MLLFLIILLRCFEPQSCITDVHFPGRVAHWLRIGTILSCGVCTFQAESSPHLPRAYYFRWRNEFLCVASRKVDLKISSFFLFLVLPLFSRCFWPQRCFRSCSICSSYNTLLPSHNKGIWTFFCPPHQHRTRMMGLWFCVLLHICTNVCLPLSAVQFYCCRSDGICMFSCMALLFLHRGT